MPIDAAIVPKDGLWRVARGPDPLVVGGSKASADAGDVGNRFDSPDGSYDVLYFGTTLAGCYGETLARFRPDPRLLAVVEADWREHGFMAVGQCPPTGVSVEWWSRSRCRAHSRFWTSSR